MTSARIMIVEDERITAEHLREILTELGYVVTAAVANGLDAVREAENTKPDLVLMDIHIEGSMDGVETACILRDRLGIPAVYLTAHADHGTLSRAREAEPLGYIVKPFQELEIEASIEMALHKSRMDRAARARQGRLADTLSSVGEAVISVDREGLITFLSPMAETLTEWTSDGAIGRSIEEVFRLIDSKTRCPATDMLWRALREGSLSEIQPGVLLLSRHGAEHPIAGAASPIRDHQGDRGGMVLIFGSAPSATDVTAPAPSAENHSSAGALPGISSFINESEAMRRIVKFTHRVATSEASTILLEGESGTGKDVLAKYLHYNSLRAAGPFIAINSAAIPDTLLESELFGYEKGAFTDARTQKKGTFELANGGTVFLDEIGEMPVLLQAKLLRVLEDQSFRRLGGVKDIQLDLRVIAATNRSLAEAVRNGRFRTDLYYRLNVIQIVVPPLRERMDDILPLANYFTGQYNQKFHRDIQGLTTEASEALLAHDWPGNVRELRNTIERAMVLEESSWLQHTSLALGDSTDAPPEPVATSFMDGLSLEESERRLLLRALEKTGGNQTQAARLLKITRDTLRYKMKKFNVGVTSA